MTIYTPSIQETINNGAVPIVPGDHLDWCPNCGGIRIVGCFQIKEGPFLTPMSRSKWLDLPDGKSGWYQVVSHYDDCPVCRGGRVRPRTILEQQEPPKEYWE